MWLLNLATSIKYGHDAKLLGQAWGPHISKTALWKYVCNIGYCGPILKILSAHLNISQKVVARELVVEITLGHVHRVPVSQE